MSEFKPSKYQAAAFDWIQERFNPVSNGHCNQHLVIEAVAGSGKTTTALKMLDYIPSNLEVIYVAFNKHIATELQTRVPENVKAMTYHSLGFSILREAFGKLQVDADKNDKELTYILDKYQYRYLYPMIKRLVSLVKANLCDSDDESLAELAAYHNIDLNGEYYLIFNAVRDLLNKSSRVNYNHSIDFDDMVYLPVIMGLNAHKYDVIIVDELQDTNKSQIELALMCIKPNGCIIGIGDRNQSIYGFRGADVSAIPNLINRLDADTLPLSITYRNPAKVVQLVNAKFSHIQFEGRENNIEGRLESIQTATFTEMVNTGNMVLCRTNAPLVEYCFMLIRKGIKATIRGRDIGKNLQSLIKKMKSTDLNDLLDKLIDYNDLESERLLRANKVNQAISLQDKIETIIALMDGCKTIDDLFTRIETIFSDEVEGVTFSSVHKAKGLESQTVFILRPDLMPHPMAIKSQIPWMIEQETNIEYVAYTRSLENLYIVAG